MAIDYRKRHKQYLRLNTSPSAPGMWVLTPVMEVAAIVSGANTFGDKQGRVWCLSYVPMSSYDFATHVVTTAPKLFEKWQVVVIR